MYPAHRRWISELMGAETQRDLGELHQSLGQLKSALASALDTKPPLERHVP
jgi:hypothetical protein